MTRKSLANRQGFSLLEVMTVVAILAIMATMAYPSMRRMQDRMKAKASATQVAGLLNEARTRALAEGTPHLVYFNQPEATADGECAPLAVEVRDADHSYSITPGDQTKEFRLPSDACQKVKQVGDGASSVDLAAVPLPADDKTTRASDAASLTGSAASGAGAANAAAQASGNSGSGSSNSGQGNSGSGNSANSGSGSAANVSANASSVAVQAAREATVVDTVVNGATFPVDVADGRPVVAFSERGIPVDPANPTAWGTGAGGVYLTDGESTVVAAVVAPLGDVQLRVFDASSADWR